MMRSSSTKFDITSEQRSEHEANALLDTMSNDEIREMLDTLHASKDSLPTSWDREFVRSIRAQFVMKLEGGFDLYPLSAKQLAQVMRIHQELAERTVIEAKRQGQRRR